jgi:calcineurin-like phosphoesterase family protein
MNFYIADTHFGHENIMKRCNRPFATVAEMDKTMLDNINSVVTGRDDLYILGDFCHWNQKIVYPSDYLSKMNGHKHLILGNHDRNIPHDKYAIRYLEEIVQYKEISDNGRKVVLSHFPIAEWNGYHTGALHIHGHIHNNFDLPVFAYMRSLENCYNVGVDVIGFTPRTLNELISMREKGMLYGECKKNEREDPDLELQY